MCMSVRPSVNTFLFDAITPTYLDTLVSYFAIYTRYHERNAPLVFQPKLHQLFRRYEYLTDFLHVCDFGVTPKLKKFFDLLFSYFAYICLVSWEEDTYSLIASVIQKLWALYWFLMWRNNSNNYIGFIHNSKILCLQYSEVIFGCLWYSTGFK